MRKEKYLISILLVSLSMMTLIGCGENKDFVGKMESMNEGSNVEKKVSEEIPTIFHISNDQVLDKGNKEQELDTNNNEVSKIEIFGRWHLEKVVLKSDAYDGTQKEALGNIDEEDYVGLELEFTDKYLRLGDDKFFYPEYTLEYKTVARYNDGGKFKLPDAYGYIRNENINIVNSEKYEWLSDVPLKFYQAKFKEDYVIPVGTKVVMLNNDTILVGTWGKILLARRVK